MQDYGSYLPEELKISADKNLRTLGDRMDIFDYVYLSFEEVTHGDMQNGTAFPNR